MPKITEASDLDWTSMMTTNAFSAAYLLKDILPHMTETGYGKVVFMSSMAAHYPGAGLGPYAASKVALESIARTAAAEAKDSGVNVNVVSITTLDSPESRKSMPNVDPTHFIPGGDIAQTILYLCSDAARSINGAVVPLVGKGSVNITL
jgi:NAD(P)-dependent dehydrogenase (short-subunit alcohol dehydrogenase family)